MFSSMLMLVLLRAQTLQPRRFWDFLNNWLIFLLRFLVNTLILFSSDVTNPASMSSTSWLWEARILLTPTVHSHSTSTVMTLILTILQRCLLRLLDRVRSDSTPISIRAEKYVWVFWELGEGLLLKIGILKCQLYFSCLSLLKESQWVMMFTSTSQDLKANKARMKENVKMKPILISLGLEMFAMQWMVRSKIHQKVLKTSLSVISTSSVKKFWKNVKNGLNTLKKEKLPTMVWWMIITVLGAQSLSNQKQNTNNCSLKKLMN